MTLTTYLIAQEHRAMAQNVTSSTVEVPPLNEVFFQPLQVYFIIAQLSWTPRNGSDTYPSLTRTPTSCMLAVYWQKLTIRRISLTSASSFHYHLDLSTKLQIHFDQKFYLLENLQYHNMLSMNHGDDHQMITVWWISWKCQVQTFVSCRFKSQLIQGQFQTYDSMGKRPQTM